MLCNVTTGTKQERMENMEKIFNYWNSKRNIVDRFGGKHDWDGRSSAENMKWLIEARLEVPYDSDSPLTEAHYRRIKVEIDAFNDALGGKFHNLAWIVPEGISKQDPTSRKFYLKLNEILNYERVQINKVLTDNGYIAVHMLDAYESIHGKGKGDKALERLKELRIEMANADPSEHVQAEFEMAIEKFIESDQGKTVKEFIELVHMNDGTFKKVPDENFRDANEFLEDGKTPNPEFGQKKSYNPHVYEAVIVARRNLTEMGKVYVGGLIGLQKIIALKYVNTDSIADAKNANKDARAMIETIQKSIDDILQKGKKDEDKGGYFPQVQFETMMEVKERLSKAMNATTGQKDWAFGNVVDKVLSQIDINKIPAHARPKSTVVQEYWEKDPLMVLKEYGDQAAQFNKMVTTQVTYLDALKHLPNTDVEFYKGLKRFIDEEYSVFTRGVSGRADWVNGAVTTLNALQTARTMGLNITGAVKNAASAIHFYSRVGMGAYFDVKKAMTGHEPEFVEVMKRAEDKAGFLFTDVAKELYTEGLITRKQMTTGEIQFNPLTGKITMENKPVKDFLVNAGKWTLDKALFFHRLTENYQRKWMFRTALYKKYNQLINEGYNKQKAEVFSTEFALKMVNSWAYEYAAHAKAKWVRGEGRVIEEMEDGALITKDFAGAKGGAQEVIMHLLHYPMSLFETHYDALRGAHKSILAGNYGMDKSGFKDSEELQYALRYAGVSGVVALSSILANTDFTNIIENETVERMHRVVDDLTKYDSKEKGTFGLLSEFTGPTIGHLKYLMISQEIIDIKHSDLNKVLFGNVDFADPDDKMSTMYSAYQLSTEWGVIKNKIWPSLKAGRGRDLVTHWLKLYPNQYTKQLNQKLFGRQPKVQRKKKPTNVDRALAVLEGMRR